MGDDDCENNDDHTLDDGDDDDDDADKDNNDDDGDDDNDDKDKDNDNDDDDHTLDNGAIFMKTIMMMALIADIHTKI